jgi:hypothetical protein
MMGRIMRTALRCAAAVLLVSMNMELIAGAATPSQERGADRGKAVASRCREKCLAQRVHCARWDSVSYSFCQRDLRKCLQKCGTLSR